MSSFSSMSFVVTSSAVRPSRMTSSSSTVFETGVRKFAVKEAEYGLRLRRLFLNLHLSHAEQALELAQLDDIEQMTRALQRLNAACCVLLKCAFDLLIPVDDDQELAMIAFKLNGVTWFS